jgi:cell division septum initiation protein DivIVA
MKFNKEFRGYNKAEVDAYIADTERKTEEVQRSQKERIFQLVEENSKLLEQVSQYQRDEQAISKSLVESQKLATELTGDAERFAALTLSRAKIFYATWQSYAKTLMSGLTDEEVRQFNMLSKRIEDIINAFEGNDVAETIAVVDTRLGSAEKSIIAENRSTIPTTKTMAQIPDRLVNPIEKVVVATTANNTELMDMLKPDKSLEELCRELGLIK